MENKDRQEAIREKGFSMNGSTEYGKIRVGVKTLDDVIIELGSYRKLWDRSGPYKFYDKFEILRAIAEKDYQNFYKALKAVNPQIIYTVNAAEE